MNAVHSEHGNVLGVKGGKNIVYIQLNLSKCKIKSVGKRVILVVL